jgi:phosphoserine aminotransferase
MFMTERPFSFEPGPTELHPLVRVELEAMSRDGYLSASHRSAEVRREVHRMESALRALLKIPERHRVLLVGSATEAMERILDGVVDRRSLHLVNGAFSRRFQTVAANLGLRPFGIELADGAGFDAASLSPDSEGLPYELLALTQNETATGARISPAAVHGLADAARAKGALVACDLVTGWPTEPIDPARLDAGFFSVQKGFGLPPGLGVIVASEALIERARTRMDRGARLGGCFHLSALADAADRGETVATPNTLGIRLLARVAEAYLDAGGQDALHQQAEDGFVPFWERIEGMGPLPLRPFVKDPEVRSRTVAVVSVEPFQGAQWAPRLKVELLRRGFQVGNGYGDWKDAHLRIAHFPVQSASQRVALEAALEASIHAVLSAKGTGSATD